MINIDFIKELLEENELSYIITKGKRKLGFILLVSCNDKEFIHVSPEDFKKANKIVMDEIYKNTFPWLNNNN